MSGVHPGVLIGGAAVGTGMAAKSGAAALLPFTGVAVGIYLVIAVGLIVTGLVLRHLGSKRGRA